MTDICIDGVDKLKDKNDFIDKLISCEVDLTPEIYGQVQQNLRILESDLQKIDNDPAFQFPTLPNANKKKKRRSNILKYIMLILRIISYVFMAIGLILALLRLIQLLRRLFSRALKWARKQIQIIQENINNPPKLNLKDRLSNGFITVKKKKEQLIKYAKDAGKRLQQAAEDQINSIIAAGRNTVDIVVQEVQTTFGPEI
jgi:hypothetical protein